MCSAPANPEPSESSDDPDPPEPSPAERPSEPVQIEVTHAVELAPTTAAALTQKLDAVLRGACDLLDRSQASLSVVIIDDQSMKALHEQFMQIPDTTDVLTFDLRSDPAEPIEGEIYVCFDEAARRADELNHPAEHEIILYALHGLLHLVGYDDHTEADWHEMHTAEDRLLEQLGIGRVFDVNGGGETR
ncbi:MAG: rRNA maturation RNase YbeY [Phycisphaeraceae bacterium]